MNLVDVIHIGFHKTATTWLQQNVLLSVPEVASLGKPYSVSLDYRDILIELAGCHEYDFDCEYFKKKFLDLNEKHKENIAKSQLKMISFERLCGELFAGIDSKQLMDRLNSVFGNPHIIITIREQSSMIESTYKHYVKNGGSLHIRELIYKDRSPSVDSFGNLHLLRKFRYDQIISYCQKIFGPDKVHVVPFELLTKEGEGEYADAFLKAMGLNREFILPLGLKSENEGLSYFGAWVLRLINQIIASPYSDAPFFRMLGRHYGKFVLRPMVAFDKAVLSRFFSKRKFLHKKREWTVLRILKAILGKGDAIAENQVISAHIREQYAESNRRTIELTGIDLSKYGYHI